MPALSQALKMRKFNPGITDVLYYMIQGGSIDSVGVLDVTDIDAPIFVISSSFGQKSSRDLRADFTGNSYGPLFSGVYTFTSVLYHSAQPSTTGEKSMVVYDASDISGAVLTTAVNGRYDDATGLFDVEYFDIDVSRQYLFGTVSSSANDYIFAMETWGTATAGISTTEGMIASDILDTLDLPLSALAARSAFDCSYDPDARVLYVVAEHDSGLSSGDVIAVNCATATSLSITGTYGNSYTNAQARSCRVLPATDNPYSSNTWLYVGTDANYLVKVNANSPGAMAQQSAVNIGVDIDYIFVPDETFNYIYVCGDGTVASIGNAKSNASVTVASSLTIAGATHLTGIGSTTLAEYGARYLFLTDRVQDKIYVVSVSGSGTLALYATWDYLAIPSSTGSTSTSRMNGPRRAIYQNLV